MKFIDSHCHLYIEDFIKDVNEVIERAIDTGVEKFYLPAIDSSEMQNLLELEAAYKGTCFAMAGLHPCSVKANPDEELALVEFWLNRRPFAAIGEIGLDFYWDTTHVAQQYEAFKQQMQWAIDFDLPIVIHTRNAMQETIETVRPFAKRGLRGIFHCFSGNEQQAEEIVAMGFLLGIGGVLTFKNAGVAEAVRNIPIANMVLETDAPYLAPVPFRGKRNESAYIQLIAKKLAEVKAISIEEVAAVTTANAEKIFAI